MSRSGRRIIVRNPATAQVGFADPRRTRKQHADVWLASPGPGPKRGSVARLAPSVSRPAPSGLSSPVLCPNSESRPCAILAASLWLVMGRLTRCETQLTTPPFHSLTALLAAPLHVTLRCTASWRHGPICLRPGRSMATATCSKSKDTESDLRFASNMSTTRRANAALHASCPGRRPLRAYACYTSRSK